MVYFPNNKVFKQMTWGWPGAGQNIWEIVENVFNIKQSSNRLP